MICDAYAYAHESIKKHQHVSTVKLNVINLHIIYFTLSDQYFVGLIYWPVCVLFRMPPPTPSWADHSFLRF